MSLRLSALLILAAVILGVAFGRYTAPKKTEVRTEIQTQTVEKVKTVTETHWLPSGEVIQTTHQAMVSDVHQAVKSDQVTEYKADSVTVSALAAIRVSDLSPSYGLSISKPVIGPIAVGAFGFSDGRVGVSVGISL